MPHLSDDLVTQANGCLVQKLTILWTVIDLDHKETIGFDVSPA